MQSAIGAMLRRQPMAPRPDAARGPEPQIPTEISQKMPLKGVFNNGGAQSPRGVDKHPPPALSGSDPSPEDDPERQT